MAESGGDKKHPATERRREQARQEGQSPRSPDLTSATLLLVAVGLLRWLGPDLTDLLSNYLTESLSRASIRSFTTNDAIHHIARAMTLLALSVLPICTMFLVGSVTVNLLQTGILFMPEKVTVNWAHVNPISGFQRMFSLPNFVRLGFGLFKLAIVVAVAYYALQSLSAGVLESTEMQPMQIAKYLLDLVMQICMRIGSALFILALLDYGFQRWKYEQDLMMTDQELRDELKDTEGDPQVAARRKQIHRQMVMKKIRSEVPKADFVATNPTELAVAIKYDPKVMPAPRVVAKGAGFVAQSIRRIALENGVPVVERKELAQFLYKTVEVGEYIPLEQYQAVADILRYVYQLKGKPIPKSAA